MNPTLDFWKRVCARYKIPVQPVVCKLPDFNNRPVIFRYRHINN